MHLLDQLPVNRCSPFTDVRKASLSPIRISRAALSIRAGVLVPGDLVLVAGATGGVGQILTAKLLERGYKVRALTRSVEKASQLLGEKEGLEIVVADARDPATLPPITEGISAVAAVTGTTAFPSKRWDGNNGPEQTDYVAMKNLIEATPKSVKRFVLTTSAGVDRSNQLPFNILNLFGVLKFKKASEGVLQQSGLPWTIVRPGRLTDGPYTSYDLNTLLQATAGTRQDVQISMQDDQSGETSRIAVAEAIVQILALGEAESKAYAITSKEGDGPGTDPAKWKALLA
ncbi:hypothetical protein WJX75_002252 [Coccomyxa subellipsoidea]|uniref:NAD(P)-binding domain-containing protein n=1 Tax=Coccomyxa subellipsoidea TaxID=248742 RepID=A0ABR2YS63_9CHLO